MMIISWALKYWKPIAGVILSAALIGGYLAWESHQQGIGEARATATYNEKIEIQKKEAADVLKKETAKVAAAEKALQHFKNIQEVKDAGNKKITDNLSARLRDIAGPTGRLRDPNAGRGGDSSGANCGAPAGTGNRPDNGAEAPGLLSAELTRFLQQKLIEADEINLAYISCRADAEATRTR